MRLRFKAMLEISQFVAIEEITEAEKLRIVLLSNQNFAHAPLTALQPPFLKKIAELEKRVKALENKKS